MDSSIIMWLIGSMLIVLGISNMRGNISSLHSYHRKRVSEADRRPFGKLVGVGTIIIGGAMMLTGVCFFAAEKLSLGVLEAVGTGVLIASIIIGLGISFYAMFKYNKGIF